MKYDSYPFDISDEDSDRSLLMFQIKKLFGVQNFFRSNMESTGDEMRERAVR